MLNCLYAFTFHVSLSTFNSLAPLPLCPCVQPPRRRIALNLFSFCIFSASIPCSRHANVELAGGGTLPYSCRFLHFQRQPSLFPPCKFCHTAPMSRVPALHPGGNIRHFRLFYPSPFAPLLLCAFALRFLPFIFVSLCPCALVLSFSLFSSVPLSLCSSVLNFRMATANFSRICRRRPPPPSGIFPHFPPFRESKRTQPPPRPLCAFVSLCPCVTLFA
jgi:hypothetical protein